jgi:6,7-dimethyl-8-ribityllumazine synthase
MVKEKGIKIGAVVSEFNYDITMMMLERAKEHAQFLGAEITQIVKVPGVFDMGLAIKKLLKRNDIDGVVSLGAVIEGETEHDEVVISHAARKIADLSIEFEKPVSVQNQLLKLSLNCIEDCDYKKKFIFFLFLIDAF